MMPQKTFKRYEKKFLLNGDQYREIIERMASNTTLDKNNRQGSYYTIFNIYYDTENSDIIRNSISHPYYKEKLRLRSYTVPKSPDETVFLEFKKKIGGIISKRRAALSLHEAEEFIRTGEKPVSAGYVNNIVFEEISQFLSRNKVSPKVFITYERMAFFVNGDRSTRITIDRNIRTRRYNVALERGAAGDLLMENNPYLMEIKFSKAMPLWLTDILSELKIYHTSFSKYGTEYKKFLVGNLNRTGKSVCYFPVYQKSALCLTPCINQ